MLLLPVLFPPPILVYTAVGSIGWADCIETSESEHLLWATFVGDVFIYIHNLVSLRLFATLI